MIRSQILKRKPLSRCAFTLLGSTLAYPFLPCLGAAPALALSPVTFVSGKGTNTGTCASPATPCRNFQFALDQTSPGGEIKVLDPANYGGVTIAKSISITGVDGAGIDRAGGPVAITINAGANDVANLSHLTVDGLKIAQTGILLNSGGSLTVTHCTFRNFLGTGIELLPPTGATKFRIADTLVSDNSTNGISVFPLGAGSAQGTLDHVLMNKNGQFGILVDTGADVTASIAWPPTTLTLALSLGTGGSSGSPIRPPRGTARASMCKGPPRAKASAIMTSTAIATPMLMAP